MRQELNGGRKGRLFSNRIAERNRPGSGPQIKITLSGGDNEGVTPVPIPNTEVKPFSADGTWLETARESRSLPDSIFLSSSMAEHSAVNRRVVGSSPTWGAKRASVQWTVDKEARPKGLVFLSKRIERVLTCAVREAGIPPAVRARILTETSPVAAPRRQGDD